MLPHSQHITHGDLRQDPGRAAESLPRLEPKEMGIAKYKNCVDRPLHHAIRAVDGGRRQTEASLVMATRFGTPVQARNSATVASDTQIELMT